MRHWHSLQCIVNGQKISKLNDLTLAASSYSGTLHALCSVCACSFDMTKVSHVTRTLLSSSVFLMAVSV